MDDAEFRTRVNKVIAAETGGLSVGEFVVADWGMLFSETSGNADNRQIIDTLEMADTLFAGMQHDKRTGVENLLTVKSFIGEVITNRKNTQGPNRYFVPTSKAYTVATQVRRVTVTTENEQAALIEVQCAYGNEEIVLDDSDYLDADYHIIISEVS